MDLLYHRVKIIHDCYTKILELIVDDTMIMFMIPIKWKAEDRAVAGDSDEETRCSASHDRGHRTVPDSEHFSYLWQQWTVVHAASLEQLFLTLIITY